MDIYQYDNSLREKGLKKIAGIDEAGRGPLAGPVVAAAVVLPEGVRIDGLRDSKKVPENEREHLFAKIALLSEDIGIGIISNEDIDRLNILKSTKLAMKYAVENLSQLPDILIIDAVTLTSIPVRQISFIKAEEISSSVAAASIVAKVLRDNIMISYHKQYPNYNFIKNKGYATKEHLELLKIYGPCPIHRKSFQRVMTLELPF
ncbi:MAG: ribonuclease HII [Nitrospirae bacterium]|nr:ribonuclease HII [Nitrospirota bacterium]